MQPHRRSGLTRRRLVPLAAAAAIIPHIVRGQQEATPTGDTYDNTGMLVDPAWLAEAHDDGVPPVIVAFMPEEEATRGVIPGSVRSDWPELETADTSPDGLAAWTRAIDQHLTGLGITAGSHVSIYDAGTLFATRLWWILHAIGHREASVLDGGLPAWIETGLPVEPGPITPTPAPGAYGATLKPGAIAPIAEVEAAVGTADVTLIDARSRQEWEDGHIPGAVNIPYDLNAIPESPRTWRSQVDLEALYAGVPRDTRVIPYCTSGVRSAVTAFTLHLVGYPDVGLFTGSWNEWVTDPTRPVATGSTP